MSLLLMLCLLILSAMVSAAESAYFALKPADIDELERSADKTDKRILEFVAKPKRLLATLLIALNFVNIAFVIASTYLMRSWFNFSDNPIIGFLFQTVLVTFMIVMIAEIIPKIYATQHPLATGRKMDIFTSFLLKVFYPLSTMLIASGSFIDKRLKKVSKTISVDELSHALELTDVEDLPNKDQRILKGIVKFGNTDVKEIMHSRMDVTAVEITTAWPDLLNVIINTGFSRIPVYKGNLDTIRGVLYIKDLLPHLEKDNFNWQSLLREPFFVPENKKIDDLLKEFQHSKIHLAIVVDEYGGTSGIVTLEDIIEEIVGDINDEFDDDEIIYSKIDKLNYVFEGKISLKDLCRILELDNSLFEKRKGDSDTLAGFLIEIEERIPLKNEELIFEGVKFRIESSDNRRIKRVKVTLPEKEIENAG